MTSRRPVNRVTSKRRPDADRQSSVPRGKAAGSPARTRRKPAVAAKKAGQRPVSTAREQRSAPAPRRRFSAPIRGVKGTGPSWFPVLGCAIAALVVGAFAVVAFFRPGVDDSNRAYVDTGATEEVRAAAENVLRTVYTVDGKNPQGYKDALRTVLTPEMLADFDKFADTTFSALAQGQVKTETKADPVGVTMLTDDRAETLVNFVVSSTKAGQAEPSQTGPILVRLQKVDGHWLASDIPNRPVIQPAGQ